MFSNVQVVGSQLDISHYSALLAPKVTDPTDHPKATKASRPEAAAETPGPHRYTIVVPKDDGTILNLGQGVGSIQTGVAMVTKTTIHAYAASEQGKFTSLVLGAPSLAGSSVNQMVAGYSLTTEGMSVHEAKGPAILRSYDSSVGLSSRDDLVMASGGLTSMSAVGGYSLTTPKSLKLEAGVVPAPAEASWGEVAASIPFFIGTAAGFLQPAVAPHSPAAGAAIKNVGDGTGYLNTLFKGGEELHDGLLRRHAEGLGKVLTHLATGAGIVISALKLRDEVKAGETKFAKVKPALDWAKSVYEEVLAIIEDLGGASGADNPGCVTIKASKNVDIQANESVSVAGFKTAISGFKSLSVSGVDASLKGHKDGSVWGGITASLKALAGEVAVSSDLGNVSINGRKSVKMTSSHDEAVVTGKKTAQLNSTEESAYVHGKQGVTVAVGGGSGAAIRLEEAKGWVGLAGGTDKLGTVDITGAHLLLDEVGARLCASDTTKSSLDLLQARAVVKSPNVDVRASTCFTVDSPKVYLG